MTFQFDFAFLRRFFVFQVAIKQQNLACCFPGKANIVVAKKDKSIERNPFRF